MADATNPRASLGFRQRLCYGVGHILNDLCASMWFSYLLVFFHKVLEFSNVLSGYVMLLGQIADALCTPFIGYESDRTKGCGNYGQRKTWHLLGCISVLCSFPFIFFRCPGCENADNWAQFVYYAPFIVIFQFGWAATQISHLSLIPELTPNESERVELNAIRYCFTVVSNLLVFAAAWLFLGLESDELGSGDAIVFRNLAIMVISVGFVFVLVFHIGVKEKPQCYDNQSVASINCEEDEVKPLTNNSRMHVRVTDWLKEHQFYQVALVYMATRLTVNLSQIYMPMYLTDTLVLPKKYIAIVPLTVFTSGFVTSSAMKITNRLIGRKVTYVLGGLMVIGACVWFYFLKAGSSWHVTLPAILLGAGNTTMLVTSLSILADLIGMNTSSGAFVYGAMSFVDKLSNGLAVVLIQNMQPCPESQVCCADCVWYYQYMMAFVPSSMAILGICGIASLSCMTIGNLKLFRGSTGASLVDSYSRAGSGTSTAETERLLAADLGIEDESECCGCCSYWNCFSSSADVQARIISPVSPTASADLQNPTPRSYGTVRERRRVHRLGYEHLSGESVPAEENHRGDFGNLEGSYQFDAPRTPPPSLANPEVVVGENLRGADRFEAPFEVPSTPPPSLVNPEVSIAQASPSQLHSGLERVAGSGRGENGQSDGVIETQVEVHA